MADAVKKGNGTLRVRKTQIVEKFKLLFVEENFTSIGFLKQTKENDHPTQHLQGQILG